MMVLLSALMCSIASAFLTGWARSLARVDSRWFTFRTHILLAGAGGAGAGALARGYAELAAFAVLALASALLVVIDLAAHRLPDAIIAPMYPTLLVLLAIAAAADGEWVNLGRSVAAAAALFASYFVLAFIAPAGLGLGDVKLSGLLGAFLGWFGWPSVLIGTLIAFVLNGAVALVLLLTTNATRRSDVAFGPSMVAGAAIGAWLSPVIARLG